MHSLVHLEREPEHSAQGWSTRNQGYAYTFATHHEAEILAFHWHPSGFSPNTFPHVHIGSAMIATDAPVRPRDFHRAHIPTGQVFIEDVVRFAIAELGVTPLRNDWDAVLAGIARQRGQVT